MSNDSTAIKGHVTAEVRDRDGNLVHRSETNNLVTDTGAQYYAGRAALGSGQPAQVTGMQLGTGSTAPAKTGAGAAIITYLPGSAHALDSGFPTASAGVVTWQAKWTAGQATSASPVTEVALITQAVGTNSAAPASATIARALLSDIPSISAESTLTVTWTHTLAGS